MVNCKDSVKYFNRKNVSIYGYSYIKLYHPFDFFLILKYITLFLAQSYG